MVPLLVCITMAAALFEKPGSFGFGKKKKHMGETIKEKEETYH